MKLTGIETLATWKRRLGYDDGPATGMFVGIGKRISIDEDVNQHIVNWRTRERHIHTRGFPIITKECLATVSDILTGHTVLDCGAGTGYLTYHLRKQAIDVEGIVLRKNKYDFKRNFMTKRLIKGDYLTHDLTPYSAFIISWPDYGHPAGFKLLQRLPKGALVVYQGEEYACCADDDFFDYLETEFDEQESLSNKLNRTHCQFYGIRDIWKVYIKR